MLTAAAPETALADLDSLSPVIFKAIEAGTQHARDYFEEIGQPHEPYLFSTLVRFQARRSLRGLGHEAEYEIDETQNLGLHLLYSVDGRGYHIRIRKAHRGSAPVPGQSHRSRLFYSQGEFVQAELPGLGCAAGTTNLLVMWDVTPAWMMKPELLIACPMGTAPFGSDVPCRWQVPVTAPYRTPTVAALAPDVDDDLDLTYIEADPESDAASGAVG